MIGTPKRLRIAFCLNANLRAAMATTIVDNINLSIGMAAQDDRAATYGTGDIVSWIGNLAVMTNKDPGAAENTRHFQIEYRRISINRAVHAIRTY
jgi:hypothetical protein